MGNLSIRSGGMGRRREQSLDLPPALIGLDEFRLAFPRRDALQQRLPPLHQPGAVSSKLGLPVEHFSLNGEVSLNRLSHARGQRRKRLHSLHAYTTQNS